MYDPLVRVIDPPGIRHTVTQPDLYVMRARLAYLAVRIRKLELTHSTLPAEAEDRVLPRHYTWSQLVFTDLFGPDVKIVTDLVNRMETIDTNLVTFRREAQALA